MKFKFNPQLLTPCIFDIVFQPLTSWSCLHCAYRKNNCAVRINGQNIVVSLCWHSWQPKLCSWISKIMHMSKSTCFDCECENDGINYIFGYWFLPGMSFFLFWGITLVAMFTRIHCTLLKSLWICLIPARWRRSKSLIKEIFWNVSDCTYGNISILSAT